MLALAQSSDDVFVWGWLQGQIAPTPRRLTCMDELLLGEKSSQRADDPGSYPDDPGSYPDDPGELPVQAVSGGAFSLVRTSYGRCVCLGNPCVPAFDDLLLGQECAGLFNASTARLVSPPPGRPGSRAVALAAGPHVGLVVWT
jgi:hypothetical protein